MLALCLLFVQGCALEPSYRGSQVKPAYPEMVVECSLLGGVTGQNDLAYTAYGLQKARYHAMDEAAKLGATHIVWEDLKQGIQPTAVGKAYRCPTVHQHYNETVYPN